MAVDGVALNRYPDRRATRLRAAIAGLHHLDASQVFCANGSNEVIQSLLLAYGGPGRSSALFEPTYALHAHIARLTSTAIVEGERDPGYLVDLAELERVLDGRGESGEDEPAVVFLCSPNNPTGLVEPDETVEAVLGRAPGLVVVDEAYVQFARRSDARARRRAPQPRRACGRSRRPGRSPALRLGYAIGAPEVVEALFEAALPVPRRRAEAGGGDSRPRVHRGDGGPIATTRLRTERGSKRGLAALGLRPVPSDANFVLFSTGDHDAHAVWGASLARSVLVRDLSAWPRLAGHLRVTIGARRRTTPSSRPSPKRSS